MQDESQSTSVDYPSEPLTNGVVSGPSTTIPCAKTTENGHTNGASSHPINACNRINTNTSTSINSEEEASVAKEKEDTGGGMDSMESLIARWCQVQETENQNSTDMLGTTLILLSLQKLERRVEKQETSLQDLSTTMHQNQSALQTDLSRILSFVKAQEESNDKHHSNDNNHHQNHHPANHHHQLRRSSTNSTAPLQTFHVTTSNHSHIPGNAVHSTAAASAISALSGSEQTVSSHQESTNNNTHNTTNNNQQQAAALQEIVLSPQHNIHRTDTNSIHPSSVFTSVRTLEKQPPRPPKRHDSFQSLGRKSIGMMSSASSVASSAVLKPPAVFVPPQTEDDDDSPPVDTMKPPEPTITTTSNSIKRTTSASTNTTINTGATTTVANNTSAIAGIAGAAALTRSRSKSSFRSSTPQLDIIWDASEHTTGQSPQQAAKARTTADNTNLNSKGMNLRFNAIKAKRPMLAASLDDDDDDSEDARSAKVFGAVKSYMDVASAAGNASGGIPTLAPINNHDSCLTGVQSFMDEVEYDDDDDDDDEDLEDLEEEHDNSNSHNSNSNDDDKPLEEPQNNGGFVLSAAVSIAESTESEDDFDDDDFDDDEDFDDNLDKTSSTKSDSKKERKQRKKERKEARKRERKEKKEKKKKSKSIIINNKVSPSETEGKEHRKKSRFSLPSTAKIIWKRSTGTNKESSRSRDSSPVRSREQSPVMPQRQISTKTSNSGERPPPTLDRAFSFVDDNPRTHQVASGADPPLQPPSTAAPTKKLHRRNTSETNNITQTTRGSTRSFTEASETMTVKTPMTAKTPQDAIARNDIAEPPPPPQAQKTRQIFNHQQHASAQNRQHPFNLYSNQHPHQPQQAYDNRENDFHQPPRRRAPFPRARGMMPTLVNSKREIVIAGGESSRLQISSLTLDTALPSADAGSVLQEVMNKSITDKCKERGTYTGTLNESEEPDGFGTMIYNSGAFYKGHWKEGHWHGHGILRTPNGDGYEGDFVYDCRHGRGIYKYENGDVYEGDFSSDKRHGKGTFLFQSGSMYRGDFAFGNFHGYGWYEFDEGYYEGSWAEGVYEGIGSLIYKDGSHYTGRFKGGVADGLGEEVKPDGSTKRGIWRSGEFIGQADGEETASNNHDIVLSL